MRFGNLPGLPAAFATCNRIFAMSVTSRTTKERTRMVKTGGPWGKEAWPQSPHQLGDHETDDISQPMGCRQRWPRPSWQQLPRGLVQSLRLMLLHAPGSFFQMDESKFQMEGWYSARNGRLKHVSTFAIGETVWIMWGNPEIAFGDSQVESLQNADVSRGLFGCGQVAAAKPTVTNIGTMPMRNSTPRPPLWTTGKWSE